MVDQTNATTNPRKPPQWLLKAARESSGVPANPAFLNQLRYTRDHPEEVEQRLRGDSIKAGRDPDAFRKMLASRKEDAQSQLTQWPKEGPTEAADMREFQDIETAETTSTVETGAMSTPPDSRLQKYVRGGNTAPSKIVKRDGRREKKDRVRKQSKRSRTNSASGTASPMEVDDYYHAESSASGAVREVTTAAPVSPPQSYPYPARRVMPTWHASISNQALALLGKKRPPEVTAIDALKACIGRCESEKNASKLAKEYNTLRNDIHKAEIKLDMDKFKVRYTRILTDAGLPRIFKEDANFPWDLKADAWYLYERWMDEDFEQDILRGIVTVKGKDRNGDRLDRAYIAKHPKDPKFFGGDGVVLGQWWPSQLCTVRDGVHGTPQGGIYGDKDKGAYSIVLSGGGYHDRDEGDVIEYSGTEGKDYEATDATLSMIKSAELGNHIRVIRSSQLLKSNKYRPSCGLRYDGLYQIKSYKEVDNWKRTYRFHMERVPGQYPIRFAGDEKRPTIFEEEAYDRCKGKL